VTSTRGQFLVASPHLPDPNFLRSVVLMVQHDDEGSFGLILNRPTNQTVSEVWDIISDESCDCEQPLNLGGPVAGPLMAIHTNERLSENEVVPGVYLSTDRDALDELVNTEFDPFRVFSGYAGWGPKQLDEELEVGGWLVASATIGMIFYEGDDLWKQVTSDIGDDIIYSAIDPRHIPYDPGMN